MFKADVSMCLFCLSPFDIVCSAAPIYVAMFLKLSCFKLKSVSIVQWHLAREAPEERRHLYIETSGFELPASLLGAP